MKKKLMMVLAAVLVFFPAKIFGQGIESGQSMVSLYGGLGSAMEKSDMEIDGKRFAWGNVGAELGLSYLYFPSSYLGLGVDLHYAGFQGSDTLEDVPGWWYWHTFESDFEMHTFQIMGAGRLNINPQSSVRLYVPFGAGVVFAQGRMDYKWDGYCEYTQTDTNTSLGWYAGIGIEFDTNERFAFGLEARYNSFRYDYNGLASDVGGDVVGKNTNHDYVSLLLSFRFK